MKWQSQLLSKMPWEEHGSQVWVYTRILLILSSETAEDLISFVIWDCLGKARLILESREWIISGNLSDTQFHTRGSKNLFTPESQNLCASSTLCLLSLGPTPKPIIAGCFSTTILLRREDLVVIISLRGLLKKLDRSEGKGPRLLQTAWAALIQATYARKSAFAMYPFLRLQMPDAQLLHFCLFIWKLLCFLFQLGCIF